MSFGIRAYNDNSEVLISSDLKNLHFFSKITSATSTDQTTTSFGGRKLHTYRVANMSTIPVPFVYMAANNEAGVISVKPTRNSSNQIVDESYDIIVLTDGTEPTLYIFADATSVSSTDQTGMVVYNSDGSAAFDSRARPLAITQTAFLSHPSSPVSSFSNSGLDAKECRSNGNSTHSTRFTPNTQVVHNVVLPTKPMFFYFSIAQAQKQTTLTASEEECDGVDGYGNCVGAKRNYFWSSTYWAFYRETIKWTTSGSGQIITQYTMSHYDCNYYNTVNGSFIGIGTGGSSDDGGTWPYGNQVVNTTDSSVCIVGDASRYD